MKRANNKFILIIGVILGIIISTTSVYAVDAAYFIADGVPWFIRGAGFEGGVMSGLFEFYRRPGAAETGIGFRIALAP